MVEEIDTQILRITTDKYFEELVDAFDNKFKAQYHEHKTPDINYENKMIIFDAIKIIDADNAGELFVEFFKDFCRKHKDCKTTIYFYEEKYPTANSFTIEYTYENGNIKGHSHIGIGEKTFGECERCGRSMYEALDIKGKLVNLSKVYDYGNDEVAYFCPICRNRLGFVYWGCTEEEIKL